MEQRNHVVTGLGIQVSRRLVRQVYIQDDKIDRVVLNKVDRLYTVIGGDSQIAAAVQYKTYSCA